MVNEVIKRAMCGIFESVFLFVFLLVCLFRDIKAKATNCISGNKRYNNALIGKQYKNIVIPILSNFDPYILR